MAQVMAYRITVIWIMLVWSVIALGMSCPNNCTCYQGAITCSGYDLPSSVAVLPPETTIFIYSALEDEVKLSSVNFSHLSGLQELYITTPYDQDALNRKIHEIQTSDQDFLAPLENLTVLSINVVWFLEKPLDDIFLPLINLQRLDLSNTRRLNLTNLLGLMKGLRNKTKLSHIHLKNIQTYEHATNDMMFNLSRFLEPIQHCPLEYLNIGYNAFKAIYPGINRYAQSLKKIDVSHNLLSPILTSPFFTEIVLHKQLEEADFGYQGFRDDSHNDSTSKLTSRKPRSLMLEKSALYDFKPKLPKGLEKCFEAMQNDTCKIFDPICELIIKYLDGHHDYFCELLYKRFDEPPLENFYRGIPCSAMPRIRQVIKEGCGDCTVIPTCGTTKRLILKKLNIYDEVFVMKRFRNDTKCFNPANRLEYLDLADNYEYGYQSIDIFLGTNVSGLTSVKVFNLSNTGLTKFYPNIQKTFPKLEVLDMSRNLITLTRSTDFHFGDNSNIREISFASNLISTIPSHLFADMHFLEILDLSNNQIQNFDTNISHLDSLTVLNLRMNRLDQLSESTCQQLTKLATKNSTKVITVDLALNQLSCSCANRPFLRWILRDRPSNVVFENLTSYLCMQSLHQSTSDNRVLLISTDLSHLDIECLGHEWFIVIGFAVALPVCLLIFALIIVVYRKRWWFRYQYFLAHRLWQSYHQIAAFETPFTYDLFVSYNQGDQQWVDEIFQPMMEDELGLRLCLHHRDFRLGEAITEQILESIETSRKTLFILSPNFLASTWCHFEVHMAQRRLFSSGKDAILLALLHPLPNRLVSKTLKVLMETRTYVEWTENDIFGQKLFWAKLEQAVKSPIPEPFDLERQSTGHISTQEPARGHSVNDLEDEENPSIQFSEESDARDTDHLLENSGLTKSWDQLTSETQYNAYQS